MWFIAFFFIPGHYCVGGAAFPCPAGTYSSKEGLQRLRDCTICPAGIESCLVAHFSYPFYKKIKKIPVEYH